MNHRNFWPLAMATTAEVDATMTRLSAGFEAWSARPVTERAALLRRAADTLEARLPEYGGLLVKEAHKTLADCVSEVREAVDFCRYYADQAEARLADQTLPGPTGESNVLRLHGRGVFVCISPWNFPLAIFAGQVVAALVAGNTVAAKPAEQTPVGARRFVALLHAVGVPTDAVALLHAPCDVVHEGARPFLQHDPALLAESHHPRSSGAVPERVRRAVEAALAISRDA